MKFSIKDFFSKCDQIRSFLRVWSHLLKESLLENFHFLCSVNVRMKQNKTELETNIDTLEDDLLMKIIKNFNNFFVTKDFIDS